LVNWWRVVRLIIGGFTGLLAAFSATVMVTIGAGRSPETAPMTPAEIELVTARAVPATVGVEARACEGSMVGTGFVVGSQAVTSHHLVAGAGTLQVQARGRPPMALAVERVAPDRDLALSEPLPTSSDGAIGPGGLALARSDAQPRDAVVAFGWVNGQVRWIEARVQGLQPGAAYGVDGPVMLLDRRLDRGWSGGPVLDRRGLVVGVIRAVDMTTGLTLAVPSSELDQWLKTDTDVADGSSCVS
jgi:S1-C subfamily serine protease